MEKKANPKKDRTLLHQSSVEEIITKLQDNEKLLIEAQNIANLGIFQWDVLTNKVTWSDELFRIYGLKPGKFGATFEAFLDRIHPEDRERIKNNIYSSYQNKASFLTEERIIRPGGEIRYLQTRGKFILDKKGNVIRLLGVCHDITEQKISEEALHKETSYVQLLQLISAASNEASNVSSVMKFTLDLICEKAGWDIGHVFIVTGSSQKLLTSSGIWSGNISEKFKAFKTGSASLTLKPGIGSPGRVLKLKRPVWIEDVTKDKNFVRCKIAKASGIQTGIAFPVMIESEVVAVIEFFSVNSNKIDQKFLDVMTPIGVQIGRVIERKRAEKDILERETKFRVLAETANDTIVSANGEGKIIFFNKGAEKMFGYSYKEALDKPLTLLMPERFIKSHLTGFSRYLNTGIPHVMGKTTELVGKKKNGTEFPMELSLSSWKIEEGTFFTGMIRDITDRKIAEAFIHTRAVQQAAIADLGQFALLQNSMKDLFSKLVSVIHETLGSEIVSILEMDKVTGELVLQEGINWNENFKGSEWKNSFINSGKDLSLYGKANLQNAKGKKNINVLLMRLGIHSGMRIRIPGIPDRTLFIAAYEKKPRKYDSEDINFLQAASNILASAIKRNSAEEELRKANIKLQEAQKELIHSEKLAALGRFSSGIAHEIRNPLANISASAQYSLAKFASDPKMKDHLKLILRNTETANRIIKELLDFASPRGIALKKDSIKKVIGHLCELIGPRCKSANVRLVNNMPGTLPDIPLNREKLEQAFLNFTSNAIDAMPKGGVLTISGSLKNDYIIISFEDTGIGISQGDLDNIIEPFFTTKSSGTGLGLSLAHQIINAHSGSINVKSKVGKGTVIDVKIPAPGK